MSIDVTGLDWTSIHLAEHKAIRRQKKKHQIVKRNGNSGKLRLVGKMWMASQSDLTNPLGIC